MATLGRPTDLQSEDLTRLYPHEYVAVCALSNITRGKTPITFDPYRNISRQRLVTMIARTAGLAEPPCHHHDVLERSCADHRQPVRCPDTSDDPA